MARRKPARRTPPRDRIRRVVDKWLLVEPLFLAVWTMHELLVNPRIDSIRVGRGRIEYDPDFIQGLDDHQLEGVLAFEALRILLKHPYSRRKPIPELAYLASNVALQEYLETSLPFPRAREVFGPDMPEDYAKQYYEFYYSKLIDQADGPSSGFFALKGGGAFQASDGESSGGEESGEEPDEAGGAQDSLSTHTRSAKAGQQNTELWDADDLFSTAVDEKIVTAEETNSWGTMAGRVRERILAGLRPKLDYRAVLRQFRASVLSTHRRLTRMKPNRRYGYLYMGSRYDFTTNLLVAVDVSGSMSSEDLARGFSVVNRFFTYGVRSIDVIQFDTEVKGEVVSLKRARREIEAFGRGGTDFSPVIDYIDEHPDYDGAVVFTDGYAPVPRQPKNRRTKVLWLFTHEKTYEAMREGLRPIGPAAFLRDG